MSREEENPFSADRIKADFSDVTLAALRAFESTVRLGGPSEAARELNVLPSTVTPHIARLESKIGALFERRPSGRIVPARLTLEGAVLAAGLADILQRVDSCHTRLEEIRTMRLALQPKERRG